MSRDAEVQLADGEVYHGSVSIKANGWVKVTEGDAQPFHVPPHKVETVCGEVNYQSPHGRI